MKAKYTHIAASLILALSLPNIASAATVTVSDLSAGGSYTINAGDSATNAVYIASTTNATATLNVNGSWTVGSEVQLGGLYANDTAQDANINIGSTGIVSVGAFWVAGGWVSSSPGSTAYQATINIAQGGQLAINGTGFGIRSTWNLPDAGIGWTMDGTNDATSGGATQNTLGVFTMLWNQGVLQKDGANTGTFGDNFTFTPTGPGSQNGMLTAIPEPSAALLGGLGMLCLLRRRR